MKANVNIYNCIYLVCIGVIYYMFTIVRVCWIFQEKGFYLFEPLICLNSAHFQGKSIVLSTKEVPEPAGLGGFEWKN